MVAELKSRAEFSLARACREISWLNFRLHIRGMKFGIWVLMGRLKTKFAIRDFFTREGLDRDFHSVSIILDLKIKTQQQTSLQG